MRLGGSDATTVGFPLHYSEALVRRVTRRYVFDTLGPLYWFATFLVIAALVARASSGDRSWILGTLLVVASLAIAVPFAAYRAHVRNGLATLRRLPEPRSDFQADADGFSIEHPAGRLALSWRHLHRVQRHSDYWLFLPADNQFVTVPLAQAGGDQVKRLDAIVRQAGVVVR